MKALAGCTGDNVKGISGVGEITAAKWFAGTLNPTSKAYQDINDQLEVHNDNLPLVRLPFPGLELPGLRDDEVTEERKIKVEIELGMRPSRRAEKKSGFDLE